MMWPVIPLEMLLTHNKSAIRIGPFGSQLRKEELVDSGIHVVGIENVLERRFDGLGTRYITAEKFDTLRAFEITAGDILMTMMGTIGRVAIVPRGVQRSIMDSHLLRLRPNRDLAEPEYVAWVIRGSELTRRAITDRAHGAIMKGLNSSIVRALPVPLPTPSEQRRILELLNQADEYQDEKTRAWRLIDVLIQSLIDRAFSGQLTAKWRDSNATKVLEELQEQGRILRGLDRQHGKRK